MAGGGPPSPIRSRSDKSWERFSRNAVRVQVIYDYAKMIQWIIRPMGLGSYTDADTDLEKRASFDRLERATRAIVNPGVSF
jgi:hypothetical protein